MLSYWTCIRNLKKHSCPTTQLRKIFTNNYFLFFTLQSDWATTLVQPIWIWSQGAHHSFILHYSTSSWYLVSFLLWDSAMFSSLDTDNSHMITCFIVFKTRIMHGRSCVQTRWSGNFYCSSKSTNNFWSGAVLCFFFPTVLFEHSLLPEENWFSCWQACMYWFEGICWRHLQLPSAPDYNASYNFHHQMPYCSYWVCV